MAKYQGRPFRGCNGKEVVTWILAEHRLFIIDFGRGTETLMTATDRGLNFVRHMWLERCVNLASRTAGKERTGSTPPGGHIYR